MTTTKFETATRDVEPDAWEHTQLADPEPAGDSLIQAPVAPQCHQEIPIDTAPEGAFSGDDGPVSEQGPVGEFVAYHVGDLATDCEVGDSARDVRACQMVAMGLFQDREAHLVQRRFGPHRYVYYAVKR